MLKTLSIWNFALIEHVQIDFDKGLNILTGETGAGKSILLGALGMVIGRRTNIDAIRSGCEFMRVEAVFTLDNNLVKDFFKAAQQHDEKKLTNLLADNAQIKLTLSKMGQTFSLSKAQYLQQIKAAWHFADNDKYQVSDLKYNLTQAGLLATVNLKLNESRTMFAQNLNIEQNMEIELILINDKVQISAIKSTSNF